VGDKERKKIKGQKKEKKELMVHRVYWVGLVHVDEALDATACRQVLLDRLRELRDLKRPPGGVMLLEALPAS
jgi:hypothetical protein